jgi:hypothetical protein
MRELAKLTGIPFTSLRRIVRELSGAEKEKEKEKRVTIEGLTPHDHQDGEKVIDFLVDQQLDVEDRIKRRYSQKIHIEDDLPVGVALFSDLHFGSPLVDYRSIKSDTELVKNTDGFYGMGIGDYHDNWIGKLAHVQREMPVDFDSEIAMVEWWFDELRDDLLVVVGGNHDTGRTKMMAGIDYMKRILRGVNVLYDPDEIRFTLTLGKGSWRFKIRHVWRGRSIYNDTHAIEKDPRFGDDEFDIGIGGHTHRGTLFREFMFHHKRRYACLIGTYKMADDYAVKWGFPRSPNDATGALVLYPDGRMTTFTDLRSAAEYLDYARGSY